jgi:hypothetical protein
MWIYNFFKSLTLTAMHQRAIRRRPMPTRLDLEALEDRCTPAFLPAVDALASYGFLGGLWAVDVNGDGPLDLVTTRGYVTLVSLGNGDGTFQPQYNCSGNIYEPIVADLNGDGIADLAKINLNGPDLRVQLCYGDGTYHETQAIVLPSQLLPGAAAYYPAQVPTSIALGDLNADGKLDLVAAGFDLELIDQGVTSRQDQYINVLLGNGDGTFRRSTAFYVTSFTFDGIYASYGTQIPAVRDFDGDRKSDVFFVTDSGGLLFVGNGDGTLQGPPRSLGTGAPVPDLNADGKKDRLDFVCDARAQYPDEYYTTRQAQVQLGIGDGSFAPAVTSDLGTVYGATDFEGYLLADFDGNGFPDLAMSEFRNFSIGSSYIAVALNDGNWSPPPSITINNATVIEGNAGTRAATFTVALSVAYSEVVTIAYATADSSAAAGSDYRAATGTLTFAPGETTKTITVLVNGDRLGEPNETFVVNLTSPTNATIDDSQGVGTILDDEPRISIGDVTKAEGKKGQTTLFTFTITLSAAYEQPVTVSYRTVDGTAKTSDKDYVAKSGTLTIAPGEKTKTITIVVKGDSKQEANETFYLDLFGLSSNAVFTKNRGISTILNDD